MAQQVSARTRVACGLVRRLICEFMSTSNQLELEKNAKPESQSVSSGQQGTITPGLGGTTVGQITQRYWPSVLLVGILITLFAGVLTSLIADWYQLPDYSHGFFVPLLSIYLIWRKRNRLARLPRQPSFYGLFIVLCSLGLLFLGSLGAELYLARTAFVGTIAGLVVYFLGWAMLREIAFPIGLLLLMIPLPALIYNEIVFPLQFWASRFATFVLETINLFPVVREGNILVIPHARLEVVEACSGIRSLMSLIALALGYVYLAEPNRYVRSALVVAMVPLAVVSNGLRVVGTALLNYYFGPKVADGFLHSFSGWMIFVVATALLLMLHHMINFFRGRYRSDTR